jgi:DNA repair photolyase
MTRIDAIDLTGPRARRGRGAVSNPAGRFETHGRVAVADGWEIITTNRSPDVPFDRSVNPYRGCEHGCVYCYARPAHAYVDLSPGLDFETRLFYKADAASLLKQAFARPGYVCHPLAFGTNTDPYQPVEQRLRVMRSLLEVCSAHDHPVTITTKSAGVLDDLPLLADLARRRLVSVAVSLTTLDGDLKRRLEPRAASAEARLRTMRRLSEAGVPVAVMTAPIIPAINDAELEAMLAAAAEHGATRAAWILLRLPNEVAGLFRDWLATHYPDRAGHVMSLVGQLRGGRDNDARFGLRMTGRGPWAEVLDRRFRIAARRLGLDVDTGSGLDTSAFHVPGAEAPQLDLF